METGIFSRVENPLSYYTVRRRRGGYASVLVTRNPGIPDMKTDLAWGDDESAIIAAAQESARLTGQPYFPRGKRP